MTLQTQLMCLWHQGLDKACGFSSTRAVIAKKLWWRSGAVKRYRAVYAHPCNIYSSVCSPLVHSTSTMGKNAHFVFLARLQMQFWLIWLKLRGKRNNAVVNTSSCIYHYLEIARGGNRWFQFLMTASPHNKCVYSPDSVWVVHIFLHYQFIFACAADPTVFGLVRELHAGFIAWRNSSKTISWWSLRTCSDSDMKEGDLRSIKQG